MADSLRMRYWGSRRARPVRTASLVACLLPSLVICAAASGPPAKPGAEFFSTAQQPAAASPAPANDKIFVTNPCSAEAIAYPLGSKGNVAPLSPLTGLAFPAGLATDFAGRIYAANTSCNSVTVYARGASGDVAPIATLSGPHTGLDPFGVAVDSKGNIYAANPEAPEGIGLPTGTVTVYAPGSNGDAAPFETIDVPGVGAIAVDANGRIFLLSASGVTVYAPGSHGMASPIETISGTQTGLALPSSIAVDSSGKIYIANIFGGDSGKGSVTVYMPGSNGDAKPIAVISGADTGLAYPIGIAVDSKGKIEVVNDGIELGIGNPSSITVYQAGSNGDAKPVATISGGNTGLYLSDGVPRFPAGIALDSTGRIYVSQLAETGLVGYRLATEYSEILVYGPGANGNAKPVAVIADPVTAIYDPVGIAVDSKGKVYVLNVSYLTVYPAGSNADSAPSAIIVGQGTGIVSPIALAVDSAGKEYVLNEEGGPVGLGDVVVFASGSKGNVAPIATIGGPNTGISSPRGIALDSTGKIYVLNPSIGITVYAAGSQGDVAPIATIQNVPGKGIAVDSKGQIYVADPSNNVVTIYSALSRGHPNPIATIGGPHTGLDSPWGIAVDRTGKIYVTNELAQTVTVYSPGQRWQRGADSNHRRLRDRTQRVRSDARRARIDRDRSLAPLSSKERDSRFRSGRRGSSGAHLATAAACRPMGRPKSRRLSHPRPHPTGQGHLRRHRFLHCTSRRRRRMRTARLRSRQELRRYPNRCGPLRAEAARRCS